MNCLTWNQTLKRLPARLPSSNRKRVLSQSRWNPQRTQGKNTWARLATCQPNSVRIQKYFQDKLGTCSSPHIPRQLLCRFTRSGLSDKRTPTSFADTSRKHFAPLGYYPTSADNRYATPWSHKWHAPQACSRQALPAYESAEKVPPQFFILPVKRQGAGRVPHIPYSAQ